MLGMPKIKNTTLAECLELRRERDSLKSALAEKEAECGKMREALVEAQRALAGGTERGGAFWREAAVEGITELLSTTTSGREWEAMQAVVEEARLHVESGCVEQSSDKPLSMALEALEKARGGK